jgi:glycosyltransferase involved in cell wall biosynthesis
MRVLIDHGMQVDIFALYPGNEALWEFVPELLGPRVLDRSRVHHPERGRYLRRAGTFRAAVLAETGRVLGAATRWGPAAVAKSAYAAVLAADWSRQYAHRFDHVLSYWGNYAGTCAYLFRKFGCPNARFSTFLHAGTDLYRQQVYLRRKLLDADHILTVCRFNRDFLQGLYPEDFAAISGKLTIYHLGLDLEEFRYRQDGRATHRLVAVGSFEKVKGFDTLIEAVGLLARRGVAADLDMIGSGPMDRRLRALVVSHQVEDRVRFLGWCAPRDVRSAISQATALVHPSRGLGDAVPTVIKEALASGTPVIASAVAGIPELLDDGACGVLVPPRDPAALAEAIARLLRDPELRRGYAESGRRFAVETFDLRRNGRQLAAILSSGGNAEQVWNQVQAACKS